MKSKPEPEMWVFGYGSIIWKADFPYEKRVVGHIKGYLRRFYQKSTDHRGKPNYPGRVATLLKSQNPKEEVWGCAYKIASENIESVSQHLDHRERGGYSRENVLFYPDESSESYMKPFSLFIYIAQEDNPNFAGKEDIETLAKYIATAVGASGHNTEYLYNLASSMRIIAPDIHDDHLFNLEHAVKQIEWSNKKTLVDLDPLKSSNNMITS